MCEKSEQFHCATKHNNSSCSSSNKNKLLTPACSILLGAKALVPTSSSIGAMLARQLRRWLACRRRRKRRKSHEEEQQNKCDNKNNNRTGKTTASSSRGGIEKQSRGIRVINSKRNENSASRAMALTARLLLAANYKQSGLLLARNSNCLATEKMAAVVELEECILPRPLLAVCTATIKTKTTTASLIRPLSKLVKSKRLSSRRRPGAVVGADKMMHQEKQQQQQKAAYSQTAATVANDLPSTYPEEEEEEQQQQQQQKQNFRQFPADNPLQARLQAEANERQTTFLGMQYSSQHEMQHETHELQQQQTKQQHCLPALAAATSAAAKQRVASKECVQQRSWRNLIACIVRVPHAETSETATTTTVMLNSAVHPATATATVKATTATGAATQINSRRACIASVESNSAHEKKAPTAKAIKSLPITTKNATATLTSMPSQLEHVPFVVATRKSKCRRTFALTSALTTSTMTTTTTTTTATAMTKKPTVIKATKTTTRMSKTKAPLARNRTLAAFFGDILTLLVGSVALHATAV
ncbi:protein hunchback-like [Rhagoletis pomonella]|uniref:protein hunchback-like n=1 Tax=Rhagoletis pomonella TaxID=28610 RepID=UPI001785D839|nr:protein hunchback-like [Rhagoletis pomonella]